MLHNYAIDWRQPDAPFQDEIPDYPQPQENDGQHEEPVDHLRNNYKDHFANLYFGE